MATLTIDKQLLKSDNELIEELQGLIKSNTTNALEIGKRLIVLKKRLEHGTYIDYVEKEFKLSRSMANKYTTVVTEYIGSNVESIQQLGIAKAYILRHIKKSDREEYIKDNDIYSKSVSQINKLVSQYKLNNQNIDSKAPKINSIKKTIQNYNNKNIDSLECHISDIKAHKENIYTNHEEIIKIYEEIHDRFNKLKELTTELAKEGA